MAAVRPLFTAEGLKRSAHNANYDLTLLSNYGVDPYRVVDHDTMIAAHLLGNNRLGLKPLALSILGREMTEITDLIGKGARQKTFNEVEIATALPTRRPMPITPCGCAGTSNLRWIPRGWVTFSPVWKCR